MPRNQTVTKLIAKVPSGEEILVLCYHAVSETWPADLAVRQADFREQLLQLRERGFRVVNFTEAVTAPGEGKVAAITFDDGYRSVLELALPILEELGMTATLFVPTDYIGKDEPMAWPGIDQWLGGEHESELLPLSWEEVGKLQAAGWEIGSHTRSHPHLSQIDRGLLPAELDRSKAVCEERLGRPCTSIAYPYGDHDEAVEAATHAAGYTAAAALPDQMSESDSNPMAFPRVGIYRNDSARVFRLKTAKLTRLVRESAAWPVLATGVRSARQRLSR